MIARSSTRKQVHFRYLLIPLALFSLVLILASCSSSQSRLKLKAEIYPAPLVGQEVTLHIEMLADGRDLPNTTLTVELPEGIELMAGETTWHGDLPADRAVAFDLTIKVREAGEWKILAYAGSDLGNSGFGDSVVLYVTSTLNSAVVEDEMDHPKATPPVMQIIDGRSPSKTPNTLTPAPVSPEGLIDTGYEGYYAGTVVITEYYTFLGNGLPEEAYRLLSNSAQKPHSLEEYVEAKKIFFKTVEIVTVEPLIALQRENGVAFVAPDQEDKIWFYVQIKAWGEGAMSGSARSGDLQTLYLASVKEDGNWKIDSFSTGLALPTPDLSTIIPTLDPGSVLEKNDFDSIVVIAQYYLFINHELYKQAYQLLSLSMQYENTLEEFASNIKEVLRIKEIKIVKILPYHKTTQLQGWTTPDPANKRMFFLQIYAEGENGMVGLETNGVHNYYITTIVEGGDRKISSIVASPSP